MDEKQLANFSKYIVGWIGETDTTPHETCQLLAHVLVGIASWYGYSQKEFDAAMDSLKLQFKACKKKKKEWDANKSKAK